MAVFKLDRLFRSLKHLVVALDELAALGVEFISVRDSIDFTTPAGRLLFGVLASLAEFERALIRERTLAGLDHARRRGKKLGRPGHAAHEQIRDLVGRGRSYAEVAKLVGVSKSAVACAMRSCRKPLNGDQNVTTANQPVKPESGS